MLQPLVHQPGEKWKYGVRSSASNAIFYDHLLIVV